MRLRLNTLISLLVAVMLVLALGLALWLFNVQLQDTLEEGQAARVTNVAQSVAARDDVRQALVGMTMDFTADNPLQRDIDNLRQRLGVDFIVVMDRHALRLTHPEPARIGQAFHGDDEGPALAGETIEFDNGATIDWSVTTSYGVGVRLGKQSDRLMGVNADDANRNFDRGSLTTNRIGVGITPENAITRYNRTGQVNWQLKDDSGTTRAEGLAQSFTSWSATGSTVAGLAAEEDAAYRLMRILADQIVTRLIATSGNWAQ